MKTKFLQTGNVKALVAGLGALSNTSPGVPKLSVVSGEAGRGKTEATLWYASNRGARYMVANALWGELWMLNDLYACLRGIKRAKFGTKKKAYEECKRLMDQESLPIIIDEADRIVRRFTHLEALRDLSDRTGVPIVFVGTEEVLLSLQQRETFASRISQVIQFKPLTLEEVQMATSELSGLQLDDKAGAKLLEICGGYFRDLVVALEHLERAARANKTTQPPAELVSRVSGRAVLRAA